MNENQKTSPGLDNIDNHKNIFVKKYNTINDIKENNKKSTQFLNGIYSKNENNALVEMYAEIVSVIVNDYFD